MPSQTRTSLELWGEIVRIWKEIRWYCSWRQKADLLQALSFGENPFCSRRTLILSRSEKLESEKLGGILMEQLAKIDSVLRDLRQRRDERASSG